MAVIIIATVIHKEVGAFGALTSQLCQWVIKGKAQLIFHAKEAEVQSKPKSKLCLEFKSLKDAVAFGSKFDAQYPTFSQQVSFEFFDKRSTSEIDHLRLLF
ncbi:hypothetical protein [Pacificibacter marinus]|uniref:hypothetical protein n=1 Tax=Pacificibacter marinus TaxID=658057 RepID=UPI001C075C6F|nr:hypothetical protein [Pacificibacter marinus]MBU2867628.1 hypothetical protein [Pacificibacter marinus]